VRKACLVVDRLQVEISRDRLTEIVSHLRSGEQR